MADTFKQAPAIKPDADYLNNITEAITRGYAPKTKEFHEFLGTLPKPVGFIDSLRMGVFGLTEEEEKAKQRRIFENEMGALAADKLMGQTVLNRGNAAMPQTTGQAFGTMPGPSMAVPSIAETRAGVEVGQQPGLQYPPAQFKALLDALPPNWQTPIPGAPGMFPDRPLQPVEQASLAGLREAELGGKVSFPQSAIQPPSVVTKGMELQAEAAKPKKTNEAIEKFTEVMKLAGVDPQSDEGKKWAAQYMETIASHAKPNVTNLNVNAFTPASVEAQKEQMKSTRTTFDQLKQAPVLLENIEKAKELIPGAKGFMGTGGETLLEATKFLNNRLGTKIDIAGIKNAEELRSRIFFNIMDNLKKMDAQPSQMQQQIMQDSLGKLGTDPNALANVLDAYGDTVRGKIDLHNTEVDSAEQRGVKFPYDPHIKAKKSAATTKVEGSKVLRFDAQGNQIK